MGGWQAKLKRNKPTRRIERVNAAAALRCIKSLLECGYWSA